jgi:nucleotide-binding universal stress UspA family protein
MFKRIVVGIDGSESARAALAHATALGKRHGASLYIVHGYRSAIDLAALAVDPAGASLGVQAAAVEQDLRDEAGVIVQQASQEVSSSGVECETIAIEGDASEALLDTAERIDADLIVVGNRGMKSAKRFLGNVPNRVSHHAACSVMIVYTT